jgi:hypothetical protein
MLIHFEISRSGLELCVPPGLSLDHHPFALALHHRSNTMHSAHSCVHQHCFFTIWSPAPASLVQKPRTGSSRLSAAHAASSPIANQSFGKTGFFYEASPIKSHQKCEAVSPAENTSALSTTSLDTCAGRRQPSLARSMVSMSQVQTLLCGGAIGVIRPHEKIVGLLAPVPALSRSLLGCRL